MPIEVKLREVKRLEYVCLECGHFYEGDEIRRSKNRCETCEEVKTDEEQGESHDHRC